MSAMEHPCDRYREAISCMVDGEPHPTEGADEHLACCPVCRERAEALRALGGRLQALPRSEAPGELRERVGSLLSGGTPSRRRRSLLLATGVVAVTLVVALTFILRGNSREDRVLPIYLDDHVSIVQAQTETGLLSSDPGELERWLSGRLDFATPIPRWPWARFAAARVCSLRGTRISLVRLEVDARELSLFVHPPLEPSVASGGTRASPAIHRSRGYDTACWTEGGLEYVLVAPTPARDIFARLVER